MPRPAGGARPVGRAGLPGSDRRVPGGWGSPPSPVATPRRPAPDPGMSEFLQQLVNGVTQGSVYALIALGYTMVYGVLRLINFAHGDVYMLGAYVGYFLSRRLRGAEPSLPRALVVMLGAMLTCALVGIIIERFAYRPVRRAARLTLLITAIGVSLFIENA